jgi:hypothetical protein
MTPAVGVPFSMVKIIGYGTTVSSPTKNHQNQGSDQHQHLSNLPTSMAKCDANKKRNEHLEKIGGTCQTNVIPLKNRDRNIENACTTAAS